MTQAQLDKAKANIDFHVNSFSLTRPNVEFRKGLIENLGASGVLNDSIDVVISNCVINLSPDKRAVFAEVARVLKPGGELFMSDVFCDRRIPETLQKDPILWGECLTGALYWEDFRRLMASVGFIDVRIVEESAIKPEGKIGERLKGFNFVSRTISAFKLPSLEDRCEDYGQTATYKGTIAETPDSFILDQHHVFKKDIAFPVCGNSAAMLGSTRYAPHFIVTEPKEHRGLFSACGTVSSISNVEKKSCC